MGFYYHASWRYLGKRLVMTPQGLYEDVERGPSGKHSDWSQSKILEVSFAKSVGGAIVGVLSGDIVQEIELGERNARSIILYIYTTIEQPDVDLSNRVDWRDFSALRETRYRHPIGIQFIGKITLNAEDVEKVVWAYKMKEGYSYPPLSGIKRVAAELDQKFWAIYR